MRSLGCAATRAHWRLARADPRAVSSRPRAMHLSAMRLQRFALLITLALPTAAGAQNLNLESMANDRYTRSHDYDLVNQRIAVRDFNWDSLSFTGSVSTTLIALRPAMD